MSKELKIKGALGKDFKQLFVGEEPTNIFINIEGKIRTKSIKETLEGELILSPSNLIVDSSKITLESPNVDVNGSLHINLNDTTNKIFLNDPAGDESLSIYHNSDDVIFTATGSTNIVINSGNGETIEFWHDGALRERISGLAHKHAFHYDSNNYFEIDVDANGVTELTTVDGGVGIVGDLKLIPDGELVLDSASGKTVHSKAAIGFTKISTAVGASSTTIDFRDGNKAELILVAYNNTTLNLRFPPYSGNFTLVMHQYLSGNIAIATWKALDSEGNDANNDGGSAGAIRWAGGSAPTLSTSAGSFDIVSFYWDADREMAFGLQILNFS